MVSVQPHWLPTINFIITLKLFKFAWIECNSLGTILSLDWLASVHIYYKTNDQIRTETAQIVNFTFTSERGACVGFTEAVKHTDVI